MLPSLFGQPDMYTDTVVVCIVPPFGKETAPLMKTIFDFKHLKPSAHFLNTQYRMPVPLGEFISEEVYNSKLKSVHAITDSSCVRFVDVRKGSEESLAPGWKVSMPPFSSAFKIRIILRLEHGRGTCGRQYREELLPASRLLHYHSLRRTA